MSEAWMFWGGTLHDFNDNVAAEPIGVACPTNEKPSCPTLTWGYEGYLTVGFYEDGSVGEIFITTAKAGSTISGLIECFAMAVPLAVQYGVSRKILGDKSSASTLSGTRFRTA